MRRLKQVGPRPWLMNKNSIGSENLPSDANLNTINAIGGFCNISIFDLLTDNNKNTTSCAKFAFELPLGEK